MNELLNKGLAAHRQGRFQEAEEVYRQALLAGAQEDNTEALFLYGTLLLQLGRLEQAIDFLRRAATGNPDDYRIWLNLAEALRQAGQLADAESAAKQAQRIAPGLPTIHLLLGNIDRARGFPLDALRQYRRALGGDTSLEAAWVNLVSLQLELGKASEARDEAGAGTKFCPSTELKKLLGRAHFALGETEQAIQAFILAGDAESLVMAALIRRDAGCDEDAHVFFRKALSVDPYNALALYNRARVWRGEKKLDEAVADLLACIQQHPAYRPALGFAAELLPLVGDFSGQAAVKERILSLGVVEGVAGTAPFEILCLVDDPALQLATARQASLELTRPRPVPPVADREKRLTIGYLSSDFIDHALSRVLAGVFEKHDRQNFRVIAYATRPDDGSEISRRIRGAAEVVRDVAGLSQQAIAALITQDQVDILVDLNGHTWGSMLGVLGYRPAPVQATYMGYPGTTGYAAVDYLIADGFVIPPEAEKYYSEAVVRLPNCYWAPDDRPDKPEQLTRKDCGLPEHGVVFACFNRANKFSAEMIKAWLDILAAVPDSIFWLLAEHPRLQSSLRSMAATAGVAPERLVFAEPADYCRYLGRLTLVDLFLDTYPYGAHTLAFDALRVGTPILTLCGQSFAARVAGSLLHALGIPELVAHDPGAYRRQAVSLGQDPAQLERVRRHLREARKDSPIFDVEIFTRHLEGAYRLMWQHAREGKAPIAIRVPEIRPAKIPDTAPEAHRSGQPADDLILHGKSLLAQGNPDGAREKFRLAEKCSPDNLPLCFEIGIAWYGAGEVETAIDYFRRSLALDPRCLEVHYNLGVALQHLKREEEAEKAYRTALTLNADYVPVLNNLGIVLRRMRRYEDALAPALRAAELAPRDAEVLNNLGLALADLGRWSEAKGYYAEALRLQPDYPQARSNRCAALMNCGELDAATACFKEIARAHPEDADARLNLSHALLLKGEFAQGWDEYEQRFSSQCSERSATGVRPLPQRFWQGEDLEGSSLLVWAEQGLGDQVLFAGMIPDLLARGTRVTLECDSRLVTLFQQSFPEVLVVPRQDPPTREALQTDWQLPLGSLPRHFRRSLADFPNHAGYLRADPGKAATWAQRLEQNGKLRVGLNWAGNPSFRHDRWRSARLRDLAALGDVADIEWFNLHQGERACDLESAPFPLRDFAGEWRDMDDTAAFLVNLDLVISTCTSIPHLAGALGKPVWVLVHGMPYWTWGNSEERTPWYPSARIFRQGQWRSWESLARAVADQLRKLVASRIASGAPDERK